MVTFDFEEKSATREQLDEIPRSTGVYLFSGKTKGSDQAKVLYVGKAKNLNSRVKQYFIGNSDTRPFVEFIRSRVDEIKYIVVGSEDNALILENELIKKYRPAYNIHLRDDKRYLSLRLDLEHQWPRIDVIRKIKKDGAVYLGPFSSAGRLRLTLDFIQKTFKLRSCTDHKLYNRSRPCMEYEIGRCVAPCVNYVTPEDYKKIVQSAVLFLKGQTSELVLSLKGEMEKAALEERFEAAAEIRDRIEAIEQTTNAQSVIGLQQFRQGLDQDAIAIAAEGPFTVVSLLFVRHGVIFDQRNFEFKNIKLDRESFLFEFLERYYSNENYLPHEILIPFSIDSTELGFGSRLIIPKAEEKKNFLDIAKQNAETRLATKIEKTQKLEKSLEGIQNLLSLSRHPWVMDCMDISHHQGAETVASCVRFVDGYPDKNGYRRIKLSEDQVDDFASMREALDRRYKTIEELPDLLVIDGGRGQLSSAEEILTKKNWMSYLDLVSLAKARDDEGPDPLNPHNRERIFKPGQKNPILLKENSNEELLLRYLRDEAHRFAITYHRFRKEKNLSASVLDSVEGMTARSKLKLLRRFGSIEGIRDAADIDILKEIPKRLLAPLRLVLEKLPLEG